MLFRAILSLYSVPETFLGDSNDEQTSDVGKKKAATGSRWSSSVRQEDPLLAASGKRKYEDSRVNGTAPPFKRATSVNAFVTYDSLLSAQRRV